MKPLSFIIGIGALLITACQHLPNFSRSGEVRDIAITDRLSAAIVQVNAGDEIRWTNKHRTPVRITFSDYVLDKLSCRSNFSGHFYSGADTDLRPHESASLCFSKPSTIRYVVRIQPELRRREIIEPGYVEVGAFSGHPFAGNESTGESGARIDRSPTSVPHLRPNHQFGERP